MTETDEFARKQSDHLGEPTTSRKRVATLRRSGTDSEIATPPQAASAELTSGVFDPALLAQLTNPTSSIDSDLAQLEANLDRMTASLNSAVDDDNNDDYETDFGFVDEETSGLVKRADRADRAETAIDDDEHDSISTQQVRAITAYQQWWFRVGGG